MTTESRIAKLSLLTVAVLSATMEDERTLAGTFFPASESEACRSYAVEGYYDDAVEHASDWWHDSVVNAAIACDASINLLILPYAGFGAAR